MLSLTRKVGESILIFDGDQQIVRIEVVEFSRGEVKLGFEADRRYGVLRSELVTGASPKSGDGEGV